MNLPDETLRRQLEAAYLALETLGRERANGTAALNEMQAKLQVVETHWVLSVPEPLHRRPS
jgi:hypothetical protein